MPNSFLLKLIHNLHIKTIERHIQNHNPLLCLSFSRPGIWCTKCDRELWRAFVSSKRRLFKSLYHTIDRKKKKTRGWLCTLNIIVKLYLNFNTKQMNGVGMGCEYFHCGAETEWLQPKMWLIKNQNAHCFPALGNFWRATALIKILFNKINRNCLF